MGGENGVYANTGQNVNRAIYQREKPEFPLATRDAPCFFVGMPYLHAHAPEHTKAERHLEGRAACRVTRQYGGSGHPPRWRRRSAVRGTGRRGSSVRHACGSSLGSLCQELFIVANILFSVCTPFGNGTIRNLCNHIQFFFNFRIYFVFGNVLHKYVIVIFVHQIWKIKFAKIGPKKRF